MQVKGNPAPNTGIIFFLLETKLGITYAEFTVFLLP
jgi:hypothetical protein